MAFTLCATVSLLVLATTARAQFNNGFDNNGGNNFDNNGANGFGGQGPLGGQLGNQSPFGGGSPFGTQAPFGAGSPFGNQSPFGTQSPFGAQSPFGSPFGGGFPNLNFGPGGAATGQQQGQIATVRAVSPTSGDRLYLTLRQVAGNQNPFLPFQRPNGGSAIRVSGYFSKGGYDTGVTSPNSLQGVFLIAVARYGNTEGGCVATGPVVQRNTNNPLNPFGQFNPFTQMLQGQRSIVSVSTLLRATAATSNIDGEIDGQNLEDLFGSSLIVCGDSECRTRTDLCGSIVRDGLSIDDYSSAAVGRSSTGSQQGILGGSLGNQLGGSLGSPLGGSLGSPLGSPLGNPLVGLPSSAGQSRPSATNVPNTLGGSLF